MVILFKACGLLIFGFCDVVIAQMSENMYFSVRKKTLITTKGTFVTSVGWIFAYINFTLLVKVLLYLKYSFLSFPTTVPVLGNEA